MIYFSMSILSALSRKSDNHPRVNREAKSIFAKLLAAEDIRVVHSARVTTAMWSGRTRTLTLPIWKEMSGDIYDMLVCHEVGHVLYTPSEDSAQTKAAQKRLAQGKSHLMESAFAFLNICEDARIERKMKNRYPGSRVSFHRGYKWMIDSRTLSMPSNLNSLKFIDRVNMFFKLGPLANDRFGGVTFNAEERRLVDRLADVSTFDQMVDVAEAMYRLAQEQKKQEQPQTHIDGGEPQPGENRNEEAMEGGCNQNIPDEPNENSPKDTRSTDDDTDDGEGADSTDGDGDSKGKSSDGKTDRNKPEDKDESSDVNPDGKSNDSGDDDKSGDKGDTDKDSDDGSKSGNDNDSESGDSSSDGDDGSDSKSDGSDDAGSDSDDAEAEKSAKGHEGGKGSPSKNDAPDTPKTMSGLEEAIEKLVDRNATERVYLNVPEAILKNLIEDHKKLHKAFASEIGPTYESSVATAIKDLAKFEKEAKPVVNVMAKRFDMMKAADEHRRAMTAKTGRLNPDMLHAYKLTEDIFLRQTHIPDGKNHGLVMFIDWSSSMDTMMSNTIKQMMNLVLFCRRVGIPFEVFGFSDADSSDGPAQVDKEGDFKFGSFTLHNWFSGRMNAREFKRAMIHMMMLVRYFGGSRRRSRYGHSSSRGIEIPYRFDLGGTPLDDCIVAAMDIVPAFQKANDVQIVNTIFLTDGASSRSPIFSAGASHTDDIVVHDPLTRADHRLADFDENRGGYRYFGCRGATAMLLTMLRDRTDSHVIGFYLLGRSVSHHDIESNMRGASHEDIEREWKRFESDKFAVCESMGYSEYYLIPGNLEAKTAALADASAESFTTMNRSKRVNRVLLNRFVDMIAKNR